MQPHQDPQPAKPTIASIARDSYFCWGLWAFLITVFVFVFVAPFAGLLAALLLPMGAVAAIACTATCIFALHKHQWRRAVSMLLLPLLIIACLGWPRLIGASLGRAANAVRLYTEQSAYEEKLKPSPPGQRPRWAMDWSEIATHNTFVIYDESGRVVRPRGDSVWAAADLAEMKVCEGRVVPIYGFYYRCDFQQVVP